MIPSRAAAEGGLPRAARAGRGARAARASARCSATTAYEIEFDDTVVGNRSPLDTPLMDSIRGFVEREDPGADVGAGGAARLLRLALVPARRSRTASPTASSRSATMDAVRGVCRSCTAPTSACRWRTSASRRRFYAEPGGGGAAMTAPVPDDKLRLGGMALRNGLLVHGPTHWAAAVRTTRGEIQVASGRKPASAAAAPSACPACAGWLKLGEAMAVIPLVKRALPAGAAADAGRAHAGRDGRRGARRPGDPLGRRRTVGREAAVALISMTPGADGAAQRRPRRLPRRRAQGDRGLRGRRRRRRRRQGARPLRLAPGHADAGRRRARQRRRAPGGSARARGRGRGGRSAAPRSRWRSSPGPSATPTAALARAAAPARPRDPARGRHARAHARSSSRWAGRRWTRSCAPRARPRP